MAKVWKDYPDTTTPITAAELNRIEAAIIAAQSEADNANFDNTVMIGGVAYQASGKIGALPTPVWTATAPCYYCTLTLTKPFEPPAGWCFALSLASTPGFIFISNGTKGYAGQALQVRVLQIGSTATNTISDINWQLIKAV